ncbi:MAG: class I SAM-dependent methyltransferase [Planctomycetes bacterium]|nr:class I SAM-dependent methyltransferase [Planctomycetota bacterium]
MSATPTSRSQTAAFACPPVHTPDDPLAARNRAVWGVGDFDRIAAGYRHDADSFVARVPLAPGERVLDLACGTGNLALPAARAGADVVGIDLAPQLLEAARTRAAAEGLAIRFEEGNAEALGGADARFDTLLSMFGVMFAPRPERVAAELLRLVRPGGRIALAHWTPASFVGDMLRAHTARVPPPSGVPSALAWGDDATVRERLAGARSVTLTRRSVHFRYPFAPAGVARMFCEAYGPTIRTLEALDANGRAGLEADLERLWSRANLARDGGTQVESEYLEVLVER